MLTEQRERFAQAVAAGMSYTDAYLATYKTKNRRSAGLRSSDLAARPEVKKRIQEIRQELADEFIWSRDQSVAILAEIATNTKAGNGDRISAVKELNAMHGFNAPVEHKVSGNVTVATIKLVGPKDVTDRVVSEQ